MYFKSRAVASPGGEYPLLKNNLLLPPDKTRPISFKIVIRK